MKFKNYLKENKNIKLKYKSLSGTKDKQIILNDRHIGTLEYDSAKKFPYGIYISGIGKILTNTREDAFSSVKIAKDVFKKYLMDNKGKFGIKEAKVVNLLKRKIEKLKEKHGYFSSSMLTKKELEQLKGDK